MKNYISTFFMSIALGGFLNSPNILHAALHDILSKDDAINALLTELLHFNIATLAPCDVIPHALLLMRCDDDACNEFHKNLLLFALNESIEVAIHLQSQEQPAPSSSENPVPSSSTEPTPVIKSSKLPMKNNGQTLSVSDTQNELLKLGGKYLQTIKSETSTIEIVQIKTTDQASLKENGSAACGPLSIYNSIMITNYLKSGDAKHILKNNNKKSVIDFLLATGSNKWVDQEGLDVLLSLNDVQKIIVQPPKDLNNLFGHLNTISITCDDSSKQSLKSSAQFSLKDFFVIHPDIKKAITDYQTKEQFIYALIVAQITPGKQGHYWAVVINKTSPTHTQFIIADSANSNHLEIDQRTRFINGIITLFSPKSA